MNGKREFTGSYSLTYISLLMPMVSVSSKCTTKKKHHWDGNGDRKPCVLLMLGVEGLVQGGRGQLTLLEPMTG